MIKQQLEKNADKIWKFLDESQVSSVFEIMKALSIEKQDVLMALGWLARENKIYFYGEQKGCKVMIMY
ncbi:MAG: winged helix-turn-helix domain-containing protein [Mariniphaga sp.]